MDFLKMLSATVTDAVDAISIANRRLALTNRLKAIERAETAKAKTVYEDIGRYVAANMDNLDMDDLKRMKEIAETAEQHAALARSHVEAMRKPETIGVIPHEENESADFVVVDDPDTYYAEKEAAEEVAEETAPVVEEIVEAVTEPAEDEPEEAEEDANDSIPFM